MAWGNRKSKKVQTIRWQKIDALVKAGVLDRKRMISNKVLYELEAEVYMRKSIAERHSVRAQRAAKVARFEESERQYKTRVHKNKKILTQETLAVYVEDQRRYKRPLGFHMVCKSAVIKGAEIDVDFLNIYHFRNWAKKHKPGQIGGLIVNYEGKVVGVENFDDAFSAFTVVLTDHEGGCNHHTKTEKTLKLKYYDVIVYNPTSIQNSCGIHCLNHILGRKLNTAEIRKTFNLEPKSMINAQTLCDIYDSCITDYDKPLKIVTENISKLSPDNHYILLKDNHYFVIEKFKLHKMKHDKVKRGLLTWDIEARPDDRGVFRDTILHAQYRDYKSDKIQFIFFESNEKSATRQFVDWLYDQSRSKNKHYVCVAHNCSRFDSYFLLACLKREEKLSLDLLLRGFSVINLQLFNHVFKDSCCYMASSLSNLCESFKITEAKQTQIEYKGKVYSSTELCFYKSELKYDDFMELKNSEPEYWALYNEYCKYDVISLFELWEKFNNVGMRPIITSMEPRLLNTCTVTTCPTIGSLAIRCLKKLLLYKTSMKFAYDDMLKFSKGNNAQETRQKYDFMRANIVGGISHCNKPGVHKNLTGYDVCSEYPAALMYCKIPSGYSKWVTEYDKTKYGYYLIKNLEFESDCKFKPIAVRNSKTGVLNWDSGNFIADEVYIDNFTIEFLVERFGLKLNFTVIKGLVSDAFVPGKTIFKHYVQPLYKAKAQQDHLKDTKDPQYNPAMRECIKMMLNCVTGKLGEATEKYKDFMFTSENTGKDIGGVNVVKEDKLEEALNPFLNAALQCYSYSKRLLFEYIRMLPNGSNDVIHVETDSIYMSQEAGAVFAANIAKYGDQTEFPIAIGSHLGNMKEEPRAAEATFVGKKDYAYLVDAAHPDLLINAAGKEINKFRLKGVPLFNVNDNGEKVQLVKYEHYGMRLRGEYVEYTFNTMKKTLFGETQIEKKTITRSFGTKPELELQTFDASDLDSCTEDDYFLL